MTVLFGPNCEDLESSFTWGWTNQGPRLGTSLYISQFPSGLESALSFSTQDWRLHFPGWSGNTEDISLEQNGAEQSRQREVDWTRVEQSLAVYPERGLTPGPPHSKAASQPCCSTAVLFHIWAVTLLSWLCYIYMCCISLPRIATQPPG